MDVTPPLLLIVGFPDTPFPFVMVIPDPAVSVLPENVAVPSNATIPAALIFRSLDVAIINP
jgi:hypothetical protein